MREFGLLESDAREVLRAPLGTGGQPEQGARGFASESAASYREAMGEFAAMTFLDVWYSHLRWQDVLDAFSDQLTKKQTKKGKKFATKARSKDSLHALRKLAEEVDGSYRIVSQPPLLVPFRDLPKVAGQLEAEVLLADPEPLVKIALE